MHTCWSACTLYIKHILGQFNTLGGNFFAIDQSKLYRLQGRWYFQCLKGSEKGCGSSSCGGGGGAMKEGELGMAWKGVWQLLKSLEEGVATVVSWVGPGGNEGVIWRCLKGGIAAVGSVHYTHTHTGICWTVIWPLGISCTGPPYSFIFSTWPSCTSSCWHLASWCSSQSPRLLHP